MGVITVMIAYKVGYIKNLFRVGIESTLEDFIQLNGKEDKMYLVQRCKNGLFR